MDILPEDVDLEDVETEDIPTNTFLVDDEQVAGMDDGLEAIRQAVEIMLSTTRYDFQIYTANFGIELDDLIGQEIKFIESTLPTRIREALSIDDRILREENYTFEVNGDSMLVSFDVITVYGAFSAGVEI